MPRQYMMHVGFVSHVPRPSSCFCVISGYCLIFNIAHKPKKKKWESLKRRLGLCVIAHYVMERVRFHIKICLYFCTLPISALNSDLSHTKILSAK